MKTSIRENVFDKEISKCIKGAAILFMFYLHLFGHENQIGENYFTSIFLGDNTVIVKELINIFHVCVPLFLFIGGFGFYLGKNKRILARIGGLYKKLFIVFFTVISFLLAIGELEFNAKEYVLNLTGFYYTYCKEWWFFALYIECMLFSVLIYEIFEKRFTKHANLCIIAISALGMVGGYGLKYVFPNLVSDNSFVEQIYMFAIKQPIWMCGYLFAKNDWMNDIFKKFKAFPLLLLPLWGLEFTEIPESFYLPILAPVVIYAFVLLFNVAGKPVRKVFVFLGDNSTYMWLTHSILIFHLIPNVIYKFHVSISCIVMLLVLDIPLALALKYLELGIDKSVKFIKDRNKEK